MRRSAPPRFLISLEQARRMADATYTLCPGCGQWVDPSAPGSIYAVGLASASAEYREEAKAYALVAFARRPGGDT